MAEPFLGEVRMFGFNFPPKGWALCNGQLLPINQTQALFALLGTTYGGNGQTNFALPNLQSRIPMHFGNGFTQGQVAGEEAVTLQVSQIPAHNHSLNANSANGTAATPAGNYWAGSAANPYTTTGGNVMNPQDVSLAPAGGGQPHDNMPPFLVINFCIALVGIFPSRN